MRTFFLICILALAACGGPVPCETAADCPTGEVCAPTADVDVAGDFACSEPRPMHKEGFPTVPR